MNEPRRLPWNVALKTFASAWNQGQHVSIIGPTGTGKTTLANEILACRRYVVVLATKRTDPAFQAARSNGFVRVTSWPPGKAATKFLLHLPAKGPGKEDSIKQREAVARFLRDVWHAGGWCVYVDELRRIADSKQLGLSPLVVSLWTEGRSAGTSLVAGFQRPAHVPLEAYDQAQHIWAFHDPDERQVRRLREAVLPPGAIDAYKALDREKYEVLYVDVIRQEHYITRVER